MNRKNSYKDLDKWRKTCRKQNQKYYNKTAFKYEKRTWDTFEDEIILKHELSDTQLSEILHRSVRAIQIRRSRLKNNLV